MRLFDLRLFANRGDKIETSDWSEPLHIYTGSDTMTIQDMCVKTFGCLYYGIFNGALRSTDDLSKNLSEWSNRGSGTSSGSLLSFGAYAYTNNNNNPTITSGFGIMYNGSDDTGSYATQYIQYENGFGSAKSYSTTGTWKNCRWQKVIPMHGGIVVIGYRIVSGVKMGAYTSYYLNGSSFVFETPVVLTSHYLRNFMDYTTTTNGSTRYHYVAVGGDGYISTATSSTYSISSFKDLTWSTQQIGSVEWEHVAYGNGIIAVASGDGYITYSKDNGTTWSNPKKISGLRKISGLIFALNKFFIVGNTNPYSGGLTASKYDYLCVTTSKFKSYSEAKFVYEYSVSNRNSLIRTYYDGEKIFLFANSFYVVDRTWKSGQ